MKIYCCACGIDVEARLTNGKEVYPHRTDLAAIPIWKCDVCKNTVGCHHKTKDRHRPLGVIPTKKIQTARKLIHSIIDPLWKFDRISRNEIYKIFSKILGRQYHTAEIRTNAEADLIVNEAKKLKEQYGIFL